MTRKEVIRIAKQRLNLTLDIMESKQGEYARADGLHNFNRLSELQRQVREKSLIHLCDKQYISIQDMIDDIEDGKPMASISLWKEKIGDVINYMILLEAMVMEDKGKGL